MRSFDYVKTYNRLIDADLMRAVCGIHELKGKCEQYCLEDNEAACALANVAKVHITQHSNNIEGIITTKERMEKLVAKKVKPKNFAEEEIAGYRDALNLILGSYKNIELSHASILQIHKILYQYTNSSFGGKFKQTDNVIVSLLPDGSKVERFKPTPALQTPQAVKDICKAYNEAINLGFDALVLIPVFILDFLCIHPFFDGNGRISRLLTLLLLLQAGYTVGQYISIEKLIDKHRDLYYDALAESSANWHKNKNEYCHFNSFLLGMITYAYNDFVQRASVFDGPKPKRIEAYIKNNFRKIQKSEIIDSCPDISQTTVQRTLKNLSKAKKIQKIGGGRYTYYI